MNLFKTAGGALAILLASAAAAAAFPVTSTTSLNVRSGPGTNYRVVDTLRPGETVEVTGQRGSWYQIDGGGWASAAYLSGGGGAAVYEEDVYVDDGPYYYDRPYIGLGYGYGYYPRRHHWRPGHGHWRPGHGHWRPGKPGRPGHHYRSGRSSGGIAKFHHQQRGSRGGGSQRWYPGR